MPAGWSMFVGIDSAGDNRRAENPIETPVQLQQRPVVRLIYFLPRDRHPQPDIDEKMDKLIKGVQTVLRGPDGSPRGSAGKLSKLKPMQSEKQSCIVWLDSSLMHIICLIHGESGRKKLIDSLTDRKISISLL